MTYLRLGASMFLHMYSVALFTRKHFLTNWTREQIDKLVVCFLLVLPEGAVRFEPITALLTYETPHGPMQGKNVIG